MTENQNQDKSRHITIDGDFTNVFTYEDYIALINSTDTTGIILRAHLILEDFLNIWCSKVTGTDDLFDGKSFIGFKNKLNIAKNLGLNQQFYDVLDKFNGIRNKYSHRRQYTLEQNSFDSIISLVDLLPPIDRFLPCKKLSLIVGGIYHETGEQVEREFLWKDADLNKQIVMLFVNLMMKFLVWMQSEFTRRNISYTLVSDFLSQSK